MISGSPLVYASFYINYLIEQFLVLFHRDILVNLGNVDALAAAVGAEAEVDRSSQRVVEDHEQHRAGVRPTDGIEREVEWRNVRVPEPLDQQPIQEQEEDQSRPGDQRHLFAGQDRLPT